MDDNNKKTSIYPIGQRQSCDFRNSPRFFVRSKNRFEVELGNNREMTLELREIEVGLKSFGCALGTKLFCFEELGVHVPLLLMIFAGTPTATE